MNTTNEPKKNERVNFSSFFVILPFISCRQPDRKACPSSVKHNENGVMVYEQIPDFPSSGQDSNSVTNATFASKLMADFFFTSCPTICPVMARNMLSPFTLTFPGQYQTAAAFPHHRPPEGLCRPPCSVCPQPGVRSDKWFFVTGNKDELYEIADDYFNVVIEDPTCQPVSTTVLLWLLVDPQRHIRAYCQER